MGKVAPTFARNAFTGSTKGPAGHRVLIRPRKVEEKVGGIILVDETKDMEKRATMEGTIVAIGFQAWKTHAIAAEDASVRGKRWAEVGDRVLYSRYSGVDVPDSLRKELDPSADRLIIVNDDDIMYVL